MSTKAKATVNLKFASMKQFESLLCALTPEVEVSSTRRASVRLEKNGLTLTLVVEAEDTVALRATLNAYLRWINSTLNVISAIERA